MKDEHGMPLPHEGSPLPWCKRLGGIQADDESWVLEDSFLSAEDLDFAVHAADNIIPCRGIVRRLAEWWEDKEQPIGSLGIEASKLWSEMQRESKGGENA